MEEFDSRAYDAARDGNVEELVSVLTAHPHLIDFAKPMGYIASREPPINIACKRGHLPIVEMLIRMGGHRVLHSDWNTPLHCAAEFGHLDIMRFLVNICPELIFARSPSGKMPIHLAIMGGRVAAFKFLFALDSSGVVMSCKHAGFLGIEITNIPNYSYSTNFDAPNLRDFIPSEEESLQYRSEAYFGSLLDRLLF